MSRCAGARKERQVGQRAAEVDHAGEAVGERVGEHVVDGDVRLGRIGKQRVAHRIGQPRRLDLDMQPVGRLRIALRLEARQDVEDHQRDDALAVRRAFVDLVAAEAGAGSAGHTRRRASAKSASVCRPPSPSQIGDDVLGDRAGVEAVAAVGRRCRASVAAKFRLAMHLADPRRAAIGQEDAPCRAIGRKQLLLLRASRCARAARSRSPLRRSGSPAPGVRRTAACRGRHAASPRRRPRRAR